METTIQIDGKPLRLKASAAVPLMYRNQYGRDLMRDLQSVATSEDDGAHAASVGMIERMAYIMAKHADPEAVPDSVEAWLAELPPMTLYHMIPVVMALWSGNLARLEEAQKKTRLLTGMSPPPCSCCAPSSLESP